MRKSSRRGKSLILRLTLGYMLAHAVTMTIFFTIVWPLAVGNGEEYAGPKLALSYLREDLVVENGRLSLEQGADLRALAAVNPRFWFVLQGRDQRIQSGPVPERLSRELLTNGIVDRADFSGLGPPGRLGEASLDYFNTSTGSVIAAAGGVNPDAISTISWMLHYYEEQFWLHILTTFFTLFGAIVAIPIILRSVRPTAAAVALVEPSRMRERIPEDDVVRELQPIVGAFNALLERMEDAFEGKRRFIADVAHEIRTPLSGLALKIDALPESGTKSEIERLVFRIGQMIGQMIDVERLAARPGPREEVNLVELAKTALADATPLAFSSGYEVEFEATGQAPMRQGDRYAIQRAIANLIGNAIAHGGGTGIINVRVTATGTIEVADEGPGIDPAARERIFEPFHRERWDKDGCGLGLHLVRQVMQAHGGSVSLGATGLGAEFRLNFPCAVKSRD